MSDYRDAIYQPVKALGQGVNPYDHVAYISQMPVDQEVPPYFPINYLPFAPLTLAPVPAASAAFLVLALGAVMATSAMVVRACRRHDRLALTMYVAAAVLLSRPGFQALQYGQAAPWVGLGLAALLVGVHRDRTALIAVAIALAWAKPSLGLPLATLLVVRGLWRGVLWGTVAAWLTWVPVVGLLLRHDTPLGLLRVMLDDLSYSADHPFGKLLGLTRVDFPATFAKVFYVALPGPLEVLIGMMVFLVTAWTIRRCADPAMAVLIAVLGTLLSLWRQPYDLILVAAPLAWVLLDQRATARDRRRRGWAALAFGPAALSWGFGHAGASLLGASEQGAARLSALTGLSTAACWLLCVIDTWRRPPADAFGPLRAQPPELSTCPQ